MDMLIGVGIILVGAVVGIALVKKTMENQYPEVQVDVRYRGTRKRTKFRAFGDAIVQDNIIKILLGQYVFMGLLSELEYYLAPDGKRIYDAYARYDYLCGIKPHEQSAPKQIKYPEVVFLQNETGKTVGKVEMGKYLLMPLQIKLVNETLGEKEVKNGKDIAAGFIKAKQYVTDHTNANNPVMAIIISALPVVILAAMLSMVVYIAYLGMGDTALRIIQSNAETVQAIQNMTATIANR